MNELALFTGAGGGLLGSRLLGWRTVCYVERDAYCVEVLKARIHDGYLDDAPIWDDCTTFDGRPWAGLVDVLTAGFPCQPFSSAGKGLQEKDPRNGWPATIRIISEVRPNWLLLENVSALLSRDYAKRVFGDLAESGYDARWDCLPASAVGAPHRRDRVWIIAHSDSSDGKLPTQRTWEQDHPLQPVWNGETQSLANTDGRRFETTLPEERKVSKFGQVGEYGSSEEMADTNCGYGKRAQQEICARGYFPQYSGENISLTQGEGLETRKSKAHARRTDEMGEPGFERPSWWKVEPELGRVANGVAHRVDRLKAIGNGQVPAVVREAWNLLSEDLL